MIEVDKIYEGNAIDVMRTMPDKSVNCIITSPPYWGLRDFGIEGIVWDGDPDCPHNFNPDGAYHDNMRFRAGKNTITGNHLNPEIYTIRTPRPNGSGGKTEFIKNTHSVKNKDNISEYADSTDRATYSQYCIKCGAWKGSLGLEPTFELYIKHLIQIFDECKRILKDDGTLWVNLGDTYASGTRDNGNGYDKTRWDKSKEGQNCKGWHIQPNRKLSNYQAKCLCDIPFRFSIAMIDSGWIKRNTIIWYKPNCMPASVKDRFTVDFEYVFFFTKSKRYYFERQYEPLAEATLPRMERGVSENNKWVNGANGQTRHTMSQPRTNRKMANTDYGGNGTGLHKPPYSSPLGRNKRCVWSISTKSFKDSHFATFPETLIEPMIKAGCPEGGLVYDPFMGSGTVAVVAKRLNRHYQGSELNAEYIEMAQRRLRQPSKPKRIKQIHDRQLEMQLELSIAGG